MIGGLIAVVAIVLFVTAHEAGHFFAAKATGMKATEFFFGFGPRLWSTKKGETEYGIKAIPAGGWCLAHAMATGEAHPLARAFGLERLKTGALIDEASASGIAH